MPDASTPPTTPPGASDTTQAPKAAQRPTEGTGGASQRLREAARILRERLAEAAPILQDNFDQEHRDHAESHSETAALALADALATKETP